MKKSELRNIIREELINTKKQLNEDIIGNFLNYVSDLINAGRAAEIRKQVDDKFKKKLDTLEANRKDLESYIKGNLSKEEITNLYNKIKQ